MPPRKKPTKPPKSAPLVPTGGVDAGVLIADLRGFIQQAREGVARTANAALVLLHWRIGHRIRTELLQTRRAEYGDRIVATVSQQLTGEFGRGYTYSAVTRMIRFAELFPDRAVVATLAGPLGWSHFVEILVLKDPLKRDFYAEMCRIERWGVRTLRAKIGGMLFERTALSRKPKELAEREVAGLRAGDTLTPDLVFRDPYLLDFLGLKDSYSEKDLEAAVLREMEAFILELGAGFTFVARQKRMVIDGEDHYLDLLFFHRKLRRLVAVELKLERFKAADKGQMELYLRWLERYETEPGEEPPIGLILCEDKGDEQVELLRLDRSGIRVASYLTDLPPKAVLRKKLKAAAEHARERLMPRDAE